MSEDKDILEKSVEQLQSANNDREKAVQLHLDSLDKTMESLEGADKIKFQGVKSQIESLLATAKKGGNIEHIVEALKNIKY